MPSPPGSVILLHGFAALPIVNLPLARALRRDNLRTYRLGYDSWGLSLPEICNRLAAPAARIAESANGPVHFVGHSMGGLVARALIHRLRPPNLGHLVMLGTPNAGSELADFADRWPVTRPVLGKAAPALLTRRSADLALLLGPIDYSLGIIAGDRPLGRSPLAQLFPGPHDGKVSIASTRLPEASDHVVLPLSHNMLLYHPKALHQVRHFLRHGRFDHQPTSL